MHIMIESTCGKLYGLDKEEKDTIVYMTLKGSSRFKRQDLTLWVEPS